MKIKQSKKFYFSVEGETEDWYLQWLSKSINASPQAKFKVSFDRKIEKDPLSRAKGISVLEKTEIFHIFDRESEEWVHVQQFEKTLRRMKEAQGIGKSIKYSLGYSNFAFDLWMVLHKADCNRSLSYRHQYLGPINSAYQEHFSNMDEYKQENNFKRLLTKLTLDDVCTAINRADRILEMNRENGWPEQLFCGYNYYTVNPSLSIGEVVKSIFKQCKIPPYDRLH
ncbi:MAG: RloB family protein [Spirochaetia bacterium]|nr:RloB family protein [Spirochaetia bacterium]